jgi:lipoate-protein ligase A
LQLLHLPLTAPAEQLAADEALLDEAEAGHGAETLVFWEPRETFVVLGYANRVAAEVNVAACEQKNIPIFRRCSGGGTIVQMPGGLNYSLILRIDDTAPTSNITTANQFIMERIRVALATLFPRPQTPNATPQISVRGHTDLCLGDVKFAGNSQRRRKNFLLFHGTVLLDCDLHWIGELLRMPSIEPDYRAHRPHADFVANLHLPAEKVMSALAAAWAAKDEMKNPPLEKIRHRAREQYSTAAWNLKF